MPTVLKFPIKRSIPERSLSAILKKHNRDDFGYFSTWNASIMVGWEGSWLNKLDNAKIDTGASISLLPEKYAHELKLESGIPYQFYGINRTDECLVEVNLRKIDIKIYDLSFNEILLTNIWAAFSKLETTPILLGVKDVLEKMKIGYSKEDYAITMELIE